MTWDLYHVIDEKRSKNLAWYNYKLYISMIIIIQRDIKTEISKICVQFESALRLYTLYFLNQASDGFLWPVFNIKTLLKLIIQLPRSSSRATRHFNFILNTFNTSAGVKSAGWLTSHPGRSHRVVKISVKTHIKTQAELFIYWLADAHNVHYTSVGISRPLFWRGCKCIS